MIVDRKVIKKGEVYRVICPKTNELTLLVTCGQCEYKNEYDHEKMVVKCEYK